jgi:creatinine amidohydrolase
MRLPTALLFALSLSFLSTSIQSTGQERPAATAGHRLEDLAWPDAERVLTPETVVVVPLGAASKEHGPHLKLRNDLTMADFLTRRVIEAASVVVAPSLTYHYYPAFVEYPGSTTLSLDTAREMTADVIRSLARFGPRRFYVLNTGVSTLRALEPAVRLLGSEGILVRYTDLNAKLQPATRGVIEQPRGSHADEVETSMMLFIDPSSVDMGKAVRDYTPSPIGGRLLSRERTGKGTYSPSGIWGDPTLATRDKGRTFVEALIAGILDDIRQLRSAPLPVRTATAATAVETPAAAPATLVAADPSSESRRCSPGDERSIRGLGEAFTTYWTNGDAKSLGDLWAENGDIVHADGSIERGPVTITQNRAALFARREYRNSRHPMVLTRIRCLTADIAVADGKWDLRGVVDAAGKPMPIVEGQVSLVVKRSASPTPGPALPSDWKIEAYRYSVKPSAEPAPAPSKRPGI